MPSTPVAMLFFALTMLLGNIIYVTGMADNNPISWTSNIAHLVCRVWRGANAIDPNVGFITQPLGHLSAMDLLHGHLPWWNYFEGRGQPLAGEMQAASLFPLTLLFAMPSGLVWFHVVLEMTAGASTYFLARRLGAPVAACSVASSNVASAVVSCAHEGSTIVRTELAMAGWHAYVNGRAVAVGVFDGVYQSVTMPAGDSTVTFDFVPSHEQYALLAGLLAGLFLLGSWARDRLGLLRPKRKAAPREDRARGEEDPNEAGVPSSDDAAPQVVSGTDEPRSPLPKMPRPRTS